MDCLVSPPQPGDESYDQFMKVSWTAVERAFLSVY